MKLIQLTTIKPSGKVNRMHAIFKCDYCGNYVEKQKHNGFMAQSCGCNQGGTRVHGLSKTKINAAWRGMKHRTTNPNHKSFKHYGGRGIIVCDEWLDDFTAFYDWSMANGYKDGLSIDRIDNDGNYEPSNCRWANMYIQGSNKRKSDRNSSGYKGVSLHSKTKKWQAYITYEKQSHYLGTYDNARDAAIAYDTFAIVYGLPHTQNFS